MLSLLGGISQQFLGLKCKQEITLDYINKTVILKSDSSTYGRRNSGTALLGGRCILGLFLITPP